MASFMECMSQSRGLVHPLGAKHMPANDFVTQVLSMQGVLGQVQ